VLVVVILTLSFFASIQLLEAQVGLLLSMLSMLRLTRLGSELDALRATRADLVTRIRTRVEQRVAPDMPRIFQKTDFQTPGEV
jgi:hypothetical protein